MMKATDKQSIIIACVFIQRADAFFDRIAKVRQ